ncbi:MAG: enoyl-CoA hydratase/isomerase family protein [Pseudomonadota bacterium]
MEMNSFIKVEMVGPVGFLLIDRPQKANAYTDAMVLQMDRALDRFAADDAIRSLIIMSAAEGRFCAGADLSEIRSRTAADGFTIPSMALFDRIEALAIPVIAAIGGPAVAGGLELALACDVRIATPAARFALPETRLGILPAAGGTWRLPRVVGQSLAREVILLGRSLDAAQALAAGLVSEVVAAGSLSARALEIARGAVDLDPGAVAAAKEALNRAMCTDTGRAFVEEAQARFYGRNRGGDA